MASLSEIKNWFRTGLKPTQTQFWATWDSFWHKGTPIPQSAIQNLENTLVNKADLARLEEHINDASAHSGGGGSGGRFGIEDSVMSQNRSVNLKGHDFAYTEVGEINFSGEMSSATIPYDENNMMFVQDNGYNESIISLSPLYPSTAPTLTASINVDGTIEDFVFTLYDEEGYPEYYMEPAIIGTMVTLVSITTIADNSAIDIAVNVLKVNSNTEITPGVGGYFSIKGSRGFVSTIPDIETVGFRQINDSGYADLDGYSYIKFYQSWADEPDVPATLDAVISIDGTPTDIVFNKYVQPENGNYWIIPAISGTEVTLTSYMAPVPIPARVLMDIPRDENNERYGTPVYLDEQGMYTGYSSVPSLSEVLYRSSQASFQGIFLNNTTEYTMLNPDGYGSGGGMKVKTFEGNEAETYYMRTGINVQNASTGGVNLNFPVSGSSTTTYNLALPERNGTLATTDQIPATPQLQDVLSANPTAHAEASVRKKIMIESKSGDSYPESPAFGTARLELWDYGYETEVALINKDFFGNEKSIKIDHHTGNGYGGIAVTSYNIGLKNTIDLSHSEILDDLNYMTLGGVKKYMATVIGDIAPASRTAPGVKGEIRVTSNYVYYCTWTNTWVRHAVENNW